MKVKCKLMCILQSEWKAWDKLFLGNFARDLKNLTDFFFGGEDTLFLKGT